LLAPLASNVPLACLAAILFVVAWNMSEPRHVVAMVRKAPRADVIILLVTFLLTVFADLVVAVNIGVVLAMLHFLHRMALSVSVETHDLTALPQFQGAKHTGVPDGLVVCQVHGPLFFGAVDTFRDALEAQTSAARSIVLRLGRMPFADATGLQALDDALHQLQAAQKRVLLVEANERVRHKLQKMGVYTKLGQDMAVNSLEAAIHALQQARRF
jgi:SulP family sulfate permease